LPLSGATYYSGELPAVTKGKFLIGAPEKTGWTDQQPAKEQTPHKKIEAAKVSVPTNRSILLAMPAIGASR
jgi:hypothetical protein